MSFYREQILPRAQDKVMDRKPAREVRARLCAGLHGEVVEVGFGTGLNAPTTRARSRRFSPSSRQRSACGSLEPRIAESSAPVELAGLTGERLDLPSGDVRRRLIDLDALHHPKPRRGARRDQARPQAGWRLPLRRARPRARPEGRSLARSARTRQQTTRRRLSPDPPDPAGDRARRLHDRHARHLLLQGRTEALRLHVRRPSHQDSGRVRAHVICLQRDATTRRSSSPTR